MPSTIDPSGLKKWTILRDSKGLYTHEAILEPSGTVVHASKAKGRVVRESFEAFATGRALRATYMPPRLSDAEIAIRIKESLGQRYRLIDGNCQHFTRYCLGYKRKSPGLRGTLAVAGFAVFVLSLATRA